MTARAPPPERGPAVSIIRSFGRATSGNVAMIFALTLPVIIVVSGMAVDTSQVEEAKWSLQSSGTLPRSAAAKQFGKTKDPVELEKWAKSLSSPTRATTTRTRASPTRG